MVKSTHNLFFIYNDSFCTSINVREYRRGNTKMDNPEKVTTQDTQDKEKHNKNATQYVLDTSVHKQTQITYRDMSPPTNNWR